MQGRRYCFHIGERYGPRAGLRPAQQPRQRGHRPGARQRRFPQIARPARQGIRFPGRHGNGLQRGGTDPAPVPAASARGHFPARNAPAAAVKGHHDKLPAFLQPGFPRQRINKPSGRVHGHGLPGTVPRPQINFHLITRAGPAGHHQPVLQGHGGSRQKRHRAGRAGFAGQEHVSGRRGSRRVLHHNLLSGTQRFRRHREPVLVNARGTGNTVAFSRRGDKHPGFLLVARHHVTVKQSVRQVHPPHLNTGRTGDQSRPEPGGDCFLNRLHAPAVNYRVPGQVEGTVPPLVVQQVQRPRLINQINRLPVHQAAVSHQPDGLAGVRQEYRRNVVARLQRLEAGIHTVQLYRRPGKQPDGGAVFQLYFPGRGCDFPHLAEGNQPFYRQVLHLAAGRGQAEAHRHAGQNFFQLFQGAGTEGHIGGIHAHVTVFVRINRVIRDTVSSAAAFQDNFRLPVLIPYRRHHAFPFGKSRPDASNFLVQRVNYRGNFEPRRQFCR